MSRFGMYVKFTAQEGRGGELAGLLLQAAASMEALPDCEMYTINLSDDEPDAVWVYEVWRSAEAHQASLSMEGAAALIAQAKPLIAGVERVNMLQPLGGKGLA